MLSLLKQKIKHMKYIGNLILVLLVLSMVSCDMTKKKEKIAEKEKAELEAALQKGNQLVKMTFENMSGKLKSTIQENGAIEAIQYCRVEAVPLTTALEEEGIKISRTSSRYRSPYNAPSEEAKKILSKFENEKANGQKSETVVHRSADGTIHYYKPIYMQALCLNCHGDPGINVSDEVVTQLKELYPEDKALGYKMNDMRGAWHVEFSK